MKSKVLVAISGGVDSSTTAYLLKKQGFDVIGIHFEFAHSNNRKIINLISKSLKIPIKIINVKHEFKNSVIKYFISEYQKNRTPNPCVYCNRFMKFKLLFYWAKKLKCDFVATGHYAKIFDFNKIKIISKSKDTKKDQTYFLWNLKKEWLKKIIFPLGNYEKTEIRKIANQIKLPTANSKESQEACFVSNEKLSDFLKNYIGKQKPGKII